MLSINKKMSEAHSQIVLSNYELDSGLSEIAESGFLFKEGCYFIKKCFSVETNVSIENFPDKTGYECFINSINVDDYVESDYLPQGILLVRKIFSIWNERKENQSLIAILSLSDFGLKIKIHLRRSGECWLSDDLEDYDEAIMMVDSSDQGIKHPEIKN